MIVTKKEIESGIYGLIVADALGVPYEFVARVRTERFPCTGMVGHGTHDQEKGVWSDDTSMTLATMAAFSAPPQERYRAMMDNFVLWLDEGAFTVSGVFDVGNTCARAITNYKRGAPPTSCGEDGRFSNGNGSLMRILPASLYLLSVSDGEDKRIIDEVSSLTHAHSVSRAACKIYTDVVKAILCKRDKAELFPIVNIYGQDEYARLQEQSFYALPASEIKSGGYVVESLEAALWCFATTCSYRDCVLKAVNLGGDSDTNAAIAGGLAGLYYGKEGIPQEWLEDLQGKELIESALSTFCAEVCK